MSKKNTATAANTLLSSMMNTPSIKDDTKAMYKRKIEVIQEDIWTDVDLMHIVKHPKEFSERLEVWGKKHKMSDHGVNGYYSALMSLFYHNQTFRESNWDLFKEWQKQHKELRRPIDERYLTNKPTHRQADSYVNYDTCVSIMNKLKDGSFERLLLGMYLLIPALRSDFAQVRLYHELPNNPPKDLNYLVLHHPDGPVLVVQKHKTEDKYEEIRIQIPKLLEHQIKESLKQVKRDYLFVSSKDNTMYRTDRAWNQWANRTLSDVIKKGFTLTMFRHVWLTREDLDLKNKTGTELEKLASQMGHSISQQRKYIFMDGLDDKKIRGEDAHAPI
jgi:integrase